MVRFLGFLLCLFFLCFEVVCAFVFFLRGREGWAREYEVKGGVWVFQLKILIFSYLFDDFAPCLVHVEMNASHIFGSALWVFWVPSNIDVARNRNFTLFFLFLPCAFENKKVFLSFEIIHKFSIYLTFKYWRGKKQKLYSFFFFCFLLFVFENKKVSLFVFGMVHNFSIYLWNQQIFSFMFREWANTPIFTF